MNEKRDKTLTFHAPDLTTRQELPVAGSTVRAGFPSPADDFLDTPLDLNRELVHNPASTFFVRVAGDSMAGEARAARKGVRMAHAFEPEIPPAPGRRRQRIPHLGRCSPRHQELQITAAMYGLCDCNNFYASCDREEAKKI